MAKEKKAQKVIPKKAEKVEIKKTTVKKEGSVIGIVILLIFILIVLGLCCCGAPFTLLGL